MKSWSFAVGGEEAGIDDRETLWAGDVIVAEIGEGWDCGGRRGGHSKDVGSSADIGDLDDV